jgi:hypothetical protein
MARQNWDLENALRIAAEVLRDTGHMHERCEAHRHWLERRENALALCQKVLG